MERKHLFADILGNDETSSVIIVDLLQNEVCSFRFAKGTREDYARRLDLNKDYRQAMLSYCLKEIQGNIKERIIQNLLPERLFSILKHVGTLSMSYTLANVRPLTTAKLKVSSVFGMNGVAKFEITTEKEEVNKVYKAGGRRLAMIAESCSSFTQFQEILGPTHPLSIISPRSPRLIDELKDLIEDLSVILVCSKEVGLVEAIRAEKSLSMLPIALMTSEEILESQSLFKEGINDILNINENKELIIHRVENLSILRDYKATINDYQIDKKTGLFNIDFFIGEAETLIKNAKDNEYVLTLFQIQSFEVLKNKHGEAVGDIVSKYVKAKFFNLIPDIKLMGKYSDDKFIIIRDNKPIKQIQEIVASIKMDSPIRNLELKAGIAPISIKHGLKDAISNAEIAIEKIKNSYGTYIAMFDDEMRKEEDMRQEVLSSMEHALESNQFEIYYQPKHNVKDNSFAGAEALVRWKHPKYGVLSPATFLPIFEKTGFIRGLDRHIFARVILEMNRWKQAGIKLFPISVNLSRRDFEISDIADWIINIVSRYSIDPKLIHLEVTESAFIDNPNLIISCISELHDFGFVIELDDFGTGYSSLTTLSELDVDILKIDKSILDNDKDAKRKSVLEFTLELSKVLGLETVVEGVETETQLDRIKSLGATYVQGFYFSKPIPAAEFMEYIKK